MDMNGGSGSQRAEEQKVVDFQEYVKSRTDLGEQSARDASEMVGGRVGIQGAGNEERLRNFEQYEQGVERLRQLGENGSGFEEEEQDGEVLDEQGTEIVEEEPVAPTEVEFAEAEKYLGAVYDEKVAEDAERLPKAYMYAVSDGITKLKKDPHQMVYYLDKARWDLMGKAFLRKLGDGLEARETNGYLRNGGEMIVDNTRPEALEKWFPKDKAA